MRIRKYSPMNVFSPLTPFSGPVFFNLQQLSEMELRSSSHKLHTTLERRNPAGKLHKARHISVIRRLPISGDSKPVSSSRTAGVALSYSAAKAHILAHGHINGEVAYHRRSGRRFLSASLSRASLLVWYARRSVNQASIWDRPKPLFMDVILDLKLQYNEDVLDKLLQRLYSHEMARPPLVRPYVFTDRQSLDTYWADQAAICGTIEEKTLSRFPDSNERLTASWRNTS